MCQSWRARVTPRIARRIATHAVNAVSAAALAVPCTHVAEALTVGRGIGALPGAITLLARAALTRWILATDDGLAIAVERATATRATRASAACGSAPLGAAHAVGAESLHAIEIRRAVRALLHAIRVLDRVVQRVATFGSSWR